MASSMNVNDAVRGDLDSSFGVGGKVFLYEDTNKNRLQSRAVSILSGGRVLCAASSDELQSTYLVMLDHRGVVDVSFGEKGISRFKLSDFFPGLGLAQPYSVKFDTALQKFVMGFFVSEGGYSRKTGLARFELNGALDTAFGTGGVMIWSFDSELNVQQKNSLGHEGTALVSANSDHHGAMELLDDGGVLILATLRVNIFDHSFLVKVKNNGALDKGFGDGGHSVVLRNDRPVRAEDLVRQDEGFLVAGTNSITGEGGWFVARFDERGELDSTFAVGGYYDETPKVKSVLLYRADRSQIYIVGTSANTAAQHLFIAIQRRGVNGEEDSHFGPDGWFSALSSDGTLRETMVWKSALFNAGSTLVVAGRITGPGSTVRTVIASVEQDMGWDGRFGIEGRVTMEGETVVHDLAIQEDRKIVFTSSRNGAPDSFAIVRLHG
jgi:uncharacterized delta-60 repeat protein